MRRGVGVCGKSRPTKGRQNRGREDTVRRPRTRLGTPAGRLSILEAAPTLTTAEAIRPKRGVRRAGPASVTSFPPRKRYFRWYGSGRPGRRPRRLEAQQQRTIVGHDLTNRDRLGPAPNAMMRCTHCPIQIGHGYPSQIEPDSAGPCCGNSFYVRYGYLYISTWRKRAFLWVTPEKIARKHG